MSGPRLTPAERDDVIRRYEAGASCRRIATAIRRSYGSVHATVATAGIMRTPGGVRTPVSDAEVADWVRRYQAGEPSTAISSRPPATVIRHLREAGVEIRASGTTGHHEAEAIRAARQGAGRG